MPTVTKRDARGAKRKPTRAPEVSFTQNELAAVLGISARQVRNLSDSVFEGGIPRAKDGRYPRDRCVAWYIRFKQAEALARAAPSAPKDKAESEQRKLAAEAELAEHKVALARRELVTLDEYRAELDRVLRQVRRRIDAIPGEWSSRLLHLDGLPEARQALRALADDLVDSLRGAGGSADEDAA